MPAADHVDPVLDRLQSVALALLALFFVFWIILIMGFPSNLLWLTAIVDVFFAAMVLLQAGQRTRHHRSTLLGGILLFAVLVPFSLYFTGRGHLGGPWVGLAAAAVAPVVAWPRLVLLERAMLSVGAVGTLTLMAIPTMSRFGEALTMASVALLIFSLVVAATKPRTTP